MEEKKSVVITAGGLVGGPPATAASKKNKKKRNKKGAGKKGANNNTNNNNDDANNNNQQQQKKGGDAAAQASSTSTSPTKVKGGNDNNSSNRPQLGKKAQNQQGGEPSTTIGGESFLEFEESTRHLNADDDPLATPRDLANNNSSNAAPGGATSSKNASKKNSRKRTSTVEDLYHPSPPPSQKSELFWLFLCFIGIMASFVCYGVLLEYATSGGRKLHELSFLFVTSGLYTITAAAGRYVRDETPTTIPPARFAVLGLTSMGSTFCSVRSLRYVIYPIQVLAKSCKPVPVMIMGAFMGKKYPLRKYLNVVLIVVGVGLFMGGGNSSSKTGSSDASAANATATTTDVADDNDDADEKISSGSQLFGIGLLFISLCFDGGTGAYEDKLMSVHSVQPFDLMYNIQLGKTILAGIGLLVLNQMHIFVQMCQEMGFVLVALGLTGAMGQVFIFVTISKFGALTCSIIGLSRKVTTLVASIYIYGHHLNGIQFLGLLIAVGAMLLNFWKKKEKKPEPSVLEERSNPEEIAQMLGEYKDDVGDVELATTKH